jgi:hypothetical protein
MLFIKAGLYLTHSPIFRFMFAPIGAHRAIVPGAFVDNVFLAQATKG